VPFPLNKGGNIMKQKTVKVNGKEFKLQSIPFRSYMDITDRNTNKHGVLIKSGYAEDLIKHCVIEPKVSLESFDDDYNTGMKLVNEIESFLNSPNKSGEDKAESKE
jgi:hypothetical protein